MTSPTWIIDKSALVRLGTSSDAARQPRASATKPHRLRKLPVRVNPDRSAHRRHRMSAFRTPPICAMPVEYSTPHIEDRALDVQGKLAERGQHRAPSIPGLLIAATAEIGNHIVLHVGKDFELIAEVTGQGLERLTL